MNFSKKNRARLKGNAFFIRKTISCISFLMLLFIVSSCTDDEMTPEEREQPRTEQKKSNEKTLIYEGEIRN